MKKLTLIIVALLMWLTFPVKGYGEEKNPSELVVHQLEVNTTGAQLSVTALNSPTGNLKFKAQDLSTQKSLSVKQESVAVNLFLLFDTSRLCSLLKAEPRYELILNQLKETLDAKSLVSIATYASGSLEVPMVQRAPRTDFPKMNCDINLLSASPEKAILRLLENSKPVELPLHLWVFSTGNLAISESTLSKLKAQKAQVHLFVLNPGVDAESRALTAAMRRSLGESRVSYSLLAAGTVPARHYRLTLSLPLLEEAERMPVGLSFMAGTVQSEVTPLTVAVPKKTLLTKILLTLLAVILVLGAVYLLLRTLKYYRPKHCERCRKMLRFGETECHFCAKGSEAVILGPFNREVALKENKCDVLRLNGSVVELGTHRKSAIRLPRHPRGRRACYLKIAKENLGSGRVAYRLSRVSIFPDVEILLNGAPMGRSRYLAQGDKIQVDSVPMTFFVSENVKHETA